MGIKFFSPSKDDTIVFSREELEKLLNDVYEEGKSKCSVVEKCLLATSGCESYQVINESSEKCVSKEGGGCMKKKYCDKILSP